MLLHYEKANLWEGGEEEWIREGARFPSNRCISGERSDVKTSNLSLLTSTCFDKYLVSSYSMSTEVNLHALIDAPVNRLVHKDKGFLVMHARVSEQRV